MEQRFYDTSALRHIGISYSGLHISRLMAAGHFPQAFSLSGKGRRLWRCEDVDRYLDARAAQSAPAAVAQFAPKRAPRRVLRSA